MAYFCRLCYIHAHNILHCSGTYFWFLVYLEIIPLNKFFNLASNIPSKGLWIVSNVDVWLHCSKTWEISLPQRLKNQMLSPIFVFAIPIKYWLSYQAKLYNFFTFSHFNQWPYKEQGRYLGVLTKPFVVQMSPIYNYMWRHKAFYLYWQYFVIKQ